MYLKLNNEFITLSEVYPRYEAQEIVVGIDSSKKNTAIVVGDTHYNILDIYEIDGSADKEVLELCYAQRQLLGRIFTNARPSVVGIEDVITTESMGIKMHQSRFKITAVFMSFISFFQDTFKITPELVNNWDWKVAVLPSEFRTREHSKGSLSYFKHIQSKYADYTDDATDAVCIYKFLCKRHGFTEGVLVTDKEPMCSIYEFFLTNVRYNKELTNPSIFIYNEELLLEENCRFIANRLQMGGAGISVVNTKCLPLNVIYMHCKGDHDRIAQQLTLVVRRVPMRC